MAIKIVSQSNFCHNGSPSKTEMCYVDPQCRSTANQHLQTLGECLWQQRQSMSARLEDGFVASKSGDRDVSDKPCSGCPSTAINEENKAHLDELSNPTSK